MRPNRVSERKVPISFSLPPSVVEELRAVAVDDDRSMSWHVEAALRKYLKGRK